MRVRRVPIIKYRLTLEALSIVNTGGIYLVNMRCVCVRIKRGVTPDNTINTSDIEKYFGVSAPTSCERSHYEITETVRKKVSRNSLKFSKTNPFTLSIQ